MGKLMSKKRRTYEQGQPNGMSKKKVPAGFRLTDSTIQRPRIQPWPPTYALSKGDITRLQGIERLDQDVVSIGADAETRRRLQRDALARNSFGTASIEGNPLTLADVESLLTKGLNPSQTTLPDEREILRHVGFLTHLGAHHPPVTVADVVRLHRAYFSKILASAGHLKEVQNFIGRATDRTIGYVPSAPGKTKAELQALLDWTNEAPEHPLVRVAVFFHEFQSIHPFADGSGRLGRLLCTILLWHWGYKGVEYALLDYSANADRDGYYSALDAARRGDWDRTPWISYYLRLVEIGYRSALHRVSFAHALPARLTDRQRHVADWFARITHEHPTLRVKFNDVHAAFPEVPRRSLTYDLRRLVDARVIQRSGERKGTVYSVPTRRQAQTS